MPPSLEHEDGEKHVQFVFLHLPRAGGTSVYEVSGNLPVGAGDWPSFSARASVELDGCH